MLNIEKLIKNIIKSVSYWVASAVKSLFGNRLCLAIWNHMIAGIQEANSSYLNYHLRPKSARAIHTQSTRTKTLPILAIVIQGPVVTVDDFTYETCKIYKKHFPDALLILSTWNDQLPEIFEPFEHLGVRIVANCKPGYAGISNINLQIVSSKAGIQAAQRMGAEYALKTRTDQRMYAPNVDEYLYNITQQFPLRGISEKQHERIIGCSLNTFKYRMYGLSDMFVYGHVDDMWLYWNVDLDDRKFTEDEVNVAGASIESFSRLRICEVYLATEFLMKVGRTINWTLEDSWSAFADNFCVIDSEQIDLYWNKYNQREYRWLGYDDSQKFQQINFREWLNLYCN